MKNDIKNIDANLLRAFSALIEFGSVTKAAQKLSVTQPAVSGMIIRLRAIFADPLFVRTKKGILPTTRALEISQQVNLILSELTALLAPESFDPLQAEFTVNIAASDYAAHVILIPLIAKLAKLAPSLRIAIHPLIPSLLQEKFERSELEFALITPEETRPDWHTRHLYHEDYVCVSRSDHPLNAKKQLTLSEFTHYHHALISYSGNNFFGVTDKALATIGQRRHISLALNNFLSLHKALQLSDLLAVVPKRLALEMENSRIYPLPLVVPGFSKVLAWHEIHHRDPRHIWLREQIQVSTGNKNINASEI